MKSDLWIEISYFGLWKRFRIFNSLLTIQDYFNWHQGLKIVINFYKLKTGVLAMWRHRHSIFSYLVFSLLVNRVTRVSKLCMRVDIATRLIELDCQTPAWRIVDIPILTYYYERFTDSPNPISNSVTNRSRVTFQVSYQ